ncbi:transporter [Massilia sp. PAMC28688]|nr:transporter [Massilia sp. PAMC28688]
MAATVCACALPAIAADAEPIATDRPDFVESSNVVGKGRMQVESSVALERDSRGGVRDTVWSTPTLIRFGITDNVELRVESDGAVRQRSSAVGSAISTERGYADASLGLKWHAMDARDSLPSVGVLLHADLATGSRAFRDEGTRPSLRVVAEWELPNDVSFGIMPGLGYDKGNDRGEGTVFGILGVVAGKSWTDRLRSFVEVSSPRLARASRGGTEASLTVGSAYLITNNCQLDAALSRGLNHRTPETSLTVGLSFKL